jgi:ribosomal protein S25
VFRVVSRVRHETVLRVAGLLVQRRNDLHLPRETTVYEVADALRIHVSQAAVALRELETAGVLSSRRSRNAGALGSHAHLYWIRSE